MRKRHWDTVVVATNNPHKLEEIETILGPLMPEVTFKPLSDFGDFEVPEETGDKFIDNALIKAHSAVDETGLPAIADDSGLVVDALAGEPGPLSARWAGEHGDDDANNAKLVDAMKDVPDEERTARFYSAVCLVEPNGTEWVAEGSCEGVVGREPHGEGGFGYDPLFWPNDTPGKTMADLAPEEKNAISHRFRALQGLAAQLEDA